MRRFYKRAEYYKTHNNPVMSIIYGVSHDFLLNTLLAEGRYTETVKYSN